MATCQSNLNFLFLKKNILFWLLYVQCRRIIKKKKNKTQTQSSETLHFRWFNKIKLKTVSRLVLSGPDDFLNKKNDPPTKMPYSLLSLYVYPGTEMKVWKKQNTKTKKCLMMCQWGQKAISFPPKYFSLTSVHYQMRNT